MIVAPPAPSTTPRYLPSYIEIASQEIVEKYNETAAAMIYSRDGCTALRKTVISLYAQDELQRIRLLPLGLDERPADGAILMANRVVDTLLEVGLIPDAIVPSAEGGVAICFVKVDKYADVECLNSGEILAVTSSRGVKPNVWSLDPDSITPESIAPLSKYLSA